MEKSTALLLVFILATSLLISRESGNRVGYSTTRANTAGPAPEESSPITGEGHPQWEILQKAISLLQSAATFCENEGFLASGTNQDVVDKLNEMANDNRIDIATTKGRNAGDRANENVAATTVSVSPIWAQNNGLKSIPSYHGAVSLIAPGINLNPNMFPSEGCAPTDVAILATILFHEGVHAERMHGNEGVVSVDNEKEAYQKEAAMLCCMMDLLVSTKPEGWEDMVDTLCYRYWSISLFYSCRLGGDPGELPQCENCPSVPQWVFALWGGGDQVSEAPPPQNLLPRDPIDPGEMNVARILHRNQLGLFTFDLFPLTKKAMVTLAGPNSGAWEYDLSNQVEGDFQPLCMIEGLDGQAIICGRIEGASNSAIYRVSFSWSGTEPVLDSELLYLGNGFGDVTAVAYVYDLTGGLAVFDFTNAAVKYVNVTTGSVSTLVEADGLHSALLQARGMIADFVKPNQVLGTPAGLWFTLQAGQTLNFYDPNLTWINVVDYGYDGTLDDYIVE